MFDYELTHKNEYDIIIITEVIEHLNDINDFIKNLKNLLRPDGKIILTTPNKSFYPLTVLWATDLPPVHSWWLSEESIQFLGNSINMNVQFLDFSNFNLKHRKVINIKKVPIPITPPVFDNEGILINNSKKEYKIIFDFKKALKKLKIVKYSLKKMRLFLAMINQNCVIPDKRGTILCAILSIENK